MPVDEAQQLDEKIKFDGSSMTLRQHTIAIFCDAIKNPLVPFIFSAGEKMTLPFYFYFPAARRMPLRICGLAAFYFTFVFFFFFFFSGVLLYERENIEKAEEGLFSFTSRSKKKSATVMQYVKDVPVEICTIGHNLNKFV